MEFTGQASPHPNIYGYPLEESFEVVVTSVEKLERQERIFVTLGSVIPISIVRTDELNAFCRAIKPPHPPYIVVGEYYCTFYKDMWTRVRVLELQGENRAKVVLIDKGLYRSIVISELRLLAPQFYFQPMALEVIFPNPCYGLLKGSCLFIKFKIAHVLNHFQTVYSVEITSGPIRPTNFIGTFIDEWMLNIFEYWRPVDYSASNKYISLGCSMAVRIVKRADNYVTVVPLEWLPELREMVYSLTSFFNLYPQPNVKTLQRNSLCAVFWFGGWFRALFMEQQNSTNPGTVKVHLLDLGYDIAVEYSEVVALPPQFSPSVKRPLCFPISTEPYSDYPVGHILTATVSTITTLYEINNVTRIPIWKFQHY